MTEELKNELIQTIENEHITINFLGISWAVVPKTLLKMLVETAKQKRE